MSAEPATVPSTRPFAKSGFLIAMLAGAAIGAVTARALERLAGGTDPEFVGVLGAAFGGILGRSIWMRVARARETGRSPIAAGAFLLARVALSIALGLALFGTALPAGAAVRPLVAGVAGLLLVGVSVAEYRTMMRGRGAVAGEDRDVR